MFTTDSTTCTAIVARDFSQNTTDVLRDVWTPGKMRHVAAALKGEPVAIVLDKHTGHAQIGVTLGNVVGLRGGSGYGIVVIDEYHPRGIVHDLRKVGTIMPLTEGFEQGAKWIAKETMRAEHRAAIDKVRAEHGEAEGREWGRWSAESMYSEVIVRYEPSTGNPAFAEKWGTRGYWRASVRELALPTPAAA